VQLLDDQGTLDPEERFVQGEGFVSLTPGLISWPIIKTLLTSNAGT
jgi:hypothetical protein